LLGLLGLGFDWLGLGLLGFGWLGLGLRLRLGPENVEKKKV
jgi:hypothetical protein